MIYAERIWRGLQLGLDLFFLRLFFIGIISEQLVWYMTIVYWLAIGVVVGMAMDDFMMLQDLFRKPRKPRESNGAATH